MPVFLKDMKDNIESSPETFVFDLDDSYRYVVTNDQELKRMVREAEECLVFREGNENIDVPSAKALICRVPGDFKCL